MSKLKPSWVKTDIPKEIKVKFWEVMMGNSTHRSFVGYLNKHPAEFPDEIAHYFPLSPQTHKKLKDEIIQMPLEEVDTLPRALQSWILALRPDLKKEQTKQEAKKATATSGEQYQETPHKEKMRDMATALAAAVSLPMDFQKFIDELTPGLWIIGKGFFVNITEAGKIEPVLDLEYEELQAGQFKRHLYDALLSHLRTGGFSEVEGSIVDWKLQSGELLVQSHILFKMIMKDVGDRYGVVLSFDSLEQEGFTPDFFEILYRTVISGLKPESYLYRLRDSDLWCGANKIRTGSPGEDQESYKRTHIELREKYLNDDLARQVGKQLTTVRGTEKAVKKQLAVFADMERLPGHCELC